MFFSFFSLPFSRVCVALSAGSGAGEEEVQLPAFLVANGGVNSGFMIAHCTSAALGEPTHSSHLLGGVGETNEY